MEKLIWRNRQERLTVADAKKIHDVTEQKFAVAVAQLPEEFKITLGPRIKIKHPVYYWGIPKNSTDTDFCIWDLSQEGIYALVEVTRGKLKHEHKSSQKAVATSAGFGGVFHILGEGTVLEIAERSLELRPQKIRQVFGWI